MHETGNSQQFINKKAADSRKQNIQIKKQQQKQSSWQPRHFYTTHSAHSIVINIIINIINLSKRITLQQHYSAIK